MRVANLPPVIVARQLHVFGARNLAGDITPALFGIQHSLMARASFKRWWQRIVPPSIERSTYVLVSSVLLLALAWLWQPLAGRVWDVASPLGHLLVQAIFWGGWMLVLLSTFAIRHFDLFGLKQVYMQWRGESYR